MPREQPLKCWPKSVLAVDIGSPLLCCECAMILASGGAPATEVTGNNLAERRRSRRWSANQPATKVSVAARGSRLRLEPYASSAPLVMRLSRWLHRHFRGRSRPLYLPAACLPAEIIRAPLRLSTLRRSRCRRLSACPATEHHASQGLGHRQEGWLPSRILCLTCRRSTCR